MVTVIEVHTDPAWTALGLLEGFALFKLYHILFEIICLVSLAKIEYKIEYCKKWMKKLTEVVNSLGNSALPCIVAVHLNASHSFSEYFKTSQRATCANQNNLSSQWYYSVLDKNERNIF